MTIDEQESLEHLLSFVTSECGGAVTIHVDLDGVNLLISKLERLRDSIREDDCPHTHLYSLDACGNDLTTSKLENQSTEVNVVRHVKIYGWNEDWAVKHNLRSRIKKGR